ncbi:MAG: cysteine--tRNA ligase [Candidatus Omnitrophica bacterium]|nr:cysteine--tRNA ligase [Candidatus Omnitrophota bacterium]
MPVTLYNSLTRKNEELYPQSPPKLCIYSCGVTVYDDCHIGHARSLYIFEVIRRYLKYRAYDVRFVRNITDIDDKIINRANELKLDWKELVNKYIARYYEDMEALGIPKADVEPRATENIEDMVAYIDKLVDKGFAYATQTGVYFNVRKFPGYGKLSGQSIESMLTGVRKEADENKLDPLDFALWKSSKPGEPSWPSPWGRGRPGWHIECSVMSAKYLQTGTLDIHAGGRDLIFPHHENEIAQAEALTGKPFATHWIHHGLLTINGQKMSKSLGNFITIKDALKKYHPDVLKIFFLQAHYSSPIDFSDKKMEEASQAYERILTLRQRLLEKCGQAPETGSKPYKVDDFILSFKEQFTGFMDGDFNTPRGLSMLFEMVTACNKILDDPDSQADSARLESAAVLLKEMSFIFGLSFLPRGSSGSPDSEVLEMIESRKRYKAQKKFAEADRIRKDLEEKGIIIEDTKDGTKWRRKL